MSEEVAQTAETTPATTPVLSNTGGLAGKIKNEIILSQKLENLNVQASSLTKAFANSFLRTKSKEYKEWVSIGDEIKTSDLTDEGHLRLKIKHELMEDRVVPHHSVLILTTVPFLLYWLLKKGATYLISSRLEQYQKDQARIKKRTQQAKEKAAKRESKGLSPAAPKATKPKRRKH